jgi:hypothetical protein
MPVLVQRPAAVTFLAPVTERRAHIGVCAAVEQQPREARLVRLILPVVDPEVRLRHHSRKERGVPAEPIRIDGRSRVHVHPPIQ